MLQCHSKKRTKKKEPPFPLPFHSRSCSRSTHVPAPVPLTFPLPFPFLVAVKADTVRFAMPLKERTPVSIPVTTKLPFPFPFHFLCRNHIHASQVFGSCLREGNYHFMKGRAIFAPLNKDITKINDGVIEQLPYPN